MTPILETEFQKIVEEHKGTIYSVCYMYSKDPDEVNDLFQESLVKVWQGLPSFKGKSSLHFCRPQKENGHRAAKYGHQPF